MQNRYVGDIGDYVKLAILRRLARGRRLGVAWWLFQDEDRNGDGGHREYLDRPEEWRRFDPSLFDALAIINKGDRRAVCLLENPSLLPNASFVRELVPCEILPFAQRPLERSRWLRDIRTRFKDRDLLFLDPDNGITPERLSLMRRSAGKSVSISELQELSENRRTIIVYHHHSRRKGGHIQELRYLAQRLRDGGFRVSGALRARPWSPRSFFILDGDGEFCMGARDISRIWDGRIEWHSDADLE